MEGSYDFLPCFQEEEEEEDVIQYKRNDPTSPSSQTPTYEALSSISTPENVGPQGYQNIDESYENANLMCLFVDAESLTFAETSKDKSGFMPWIKKFKLLK